MKQATFWALCCVCTGALSFEEVEVTPTRPLGWQAVNVRQDGFVAINGSQPLFGDGSLSLATDTVTAGQDKADYQYSWQQSINQIDFPQRTLGNLDALNFAWYRDSASTTAGHFIPALRLQFYDDAGTPGNSADDTVGLLIWEGVYNGVNPAVSDSWQLTDAIDEHFWVFVSAGPGGTGVIQNFNATLSDWINGTPTGQPGDPSVSLSANTYITAINTGVGSGWNNAFIGHVDSVRIGFGADDDVLFNFEACDAPDAVDGADVIFLNSFECLK